MDGHLMVYPNHLIANTSLTNFGSLVHRRRIFSQWKISRKTSSKILKEIPNEITFPPSIVIATKPNLEKIEKKAFQDAKLFLNEKEYEGYGRNGIDWKKAESNRQRELKIIGDEEANFWLKVNTVDDVEVGSKTKKKRVIGGRKEMSGILIDPKKWRNKQQQEFFEVQRLQTKKVVVVVVVVDVTVDVTVVQLQRKL